MHNFLVTVVRFCCEPLSYNDLHDCATGSINERSQAEKSFGSKHACVAQSLNTWWEAFRHLLLRSMLNCPCFGCSPSPSRAKYAETEPLLHERCQAIQDKVLGPEYPSLAPRLNNRAGLLAVVSSRQGLPDIIYILIPFPFHFLLFRANTMRRPRCSLELLLLETRHWVRNT